MTTITKEPMTLETIDQSIAADEDALQALRLSIPEAQLVAARDFLAGKNDGATSLSAIRNQMSSIEDRLVGLRLLAMVTEYNAVADHVNARSVEYRGLTEAIADLERQLAKAKSDPGAVELRNALQDRLTHARADRMAEADFIAPLQRRIEELRPLLDGVASQLRGVVITGWLLDPPRGGRLI